MILKTQLGREDAALSSQPQRERERERQRQRERERQRDRERQRERGNSGYLPHLSRVVGSGGRRQKRGGRRGTEHLERKAG